MTSKYPIKLLLTMCLITFLLSFEDSYGEFTWDLRRQLPELPEGILKAGDIQLTEDRSITDINIPGLTRTESKYGVLFWNRKAKDEISTLDKEGAKKLAGTFLNKYFPSLSDKKTFSGYGIYSTTRTVAGKEESAVTGYSVKYTCLHRSISVLNHKIKVTIKGDKVVGVDIQVYSVMQLGNSAKLLSAEECLAKAPENLKRKYDGFTVRQVRFGYKGGFRQHWESDKDDWAKPFRAVPVYEFFIVRGLMARFMFVLDARTAELIYPKKPEGKKEIVISGPELKFTRADSYEMFLIGPEDVDIEKAVFEMENIPVESNWIIHSVRELFTDIGEWRFGDPKTLNWTYITLDSNKDQKSIARGILNIDISGEYEVEVIVRQVASLQRILVPSVQLSIDGQSRVLGKLGPKGARIWEKWGTINLDKGGHDIVLKTTPDAIRAEIGCVRLRNTSQTSKISLKDLKIDFRTQVKPSYYCAAPPLGHSSTENLSVRLESSFHSRYSRGIKGRKICSFFTSSASPGIFRIHSLKISFVTGDPKLAEEKAKQFVLIYPDGNSSRTLSIKGLKVFWPYIKNIINSPGGSRRRLKELFELCDFAKLVISRCKDNEAKEVWSDLQLEYIGLVHEETQRLANSYYLYSQSSPPPLGHIKVWDNKLLWRKSAFDGRRIVNNSTYLDPWGNPYFIKYFPKKKQICARSSGPNGRDEEGKNDDIQVEASISLLTW